MITTCVTTSVTANVTSSVTTSVTTSVTASVTASVTTSVTTTQSFITCISGNTPFTMVGNITGGLPKPRVDQFSYIFNNDGKLKKSY